MSDPGTVTEPYGSYTTEDGEIETILVFAENELRGAVQVGFYAPEAAPTEPNG